MDVTVSPKLASRIGETAGHLAGHPTNQATVPLGEGERPAGSVRCRSGFVKGGKSNGCGSRGGSCQDGEPPWKLGGFGLGGWGCWEPWLVLIPVGWAAGRGFPLV